MLSHKQRLSRSLFPDVLKRGKSLHSQHFSIKYLVSSGEPHFSLVVSKRIVKQAVSRHKLKRRVYALVNDVRSVKKPNVSIVFFGKQGAGDLSFSKVSEEIKDLLARIRT